MFQFHVMDVQDLRTLLVEELLERLPKGVTFGIYDVDFSAGNNHVFAGEVELQIDVDIVVSGFGKFLYTMVAVGQINKIFLSSDISSEEVLERYLGYLDSLVEKINEEDQKEEIKGTTYVSGNVVGSLCGNQGFDLALVS
ncbi:hypothetical protein [Bacillus cereus]|uniref:hypothetical protein n=1 Tax=Bacillus cereus TaxID=1396 RepID=UPI000BFDBDB5|nr:hypothetical protein [Bacillus cereus]PGR83749.1 hypothetical protein COC63_07095 [Bacillus cereus]